MMKTPEEIKKGLKRCAAECYDDCPYTHSFDCVEKITADALAYIQQLEDDINRIKQTLKETTERELALADRCNMLLRERDAAVEDISRECNKCKHFEVWFNGCTPDYGCKRSDVCKDNDNWEWRGVKEE